MNTKDKIKSVVLTIILIGIIGGWFYLVWLNGFGKIFWLGIGTLLMIIFWAVIVFGARREIE